MAPLYPSLQAFYKPEPVDGAIVTHKAATLSGPGDGFSKEEVESALDPLKVPFNPSREYLQCDICSLTPGLQAVTFIGRVVNFNTQYGKCKSHTAATGWHHMIVKDNTGAICVKLYFASRPYALKLGLLFTIWTPYVGTLVNNKNFTIPDAPNITSIFPGREGSVHIVIHESSENSDTCHIPLGYCKGKTLPGLMTLKSFIDGGHEVKDAKILGCVKSIGPTKTITNKKGMTSDLTEVILFDDTSEIVLKLWGTYRFSARDWTPSRTIVLLLNPTFRLERRGGCSIGFSHATMLDLEPDFPDADWLRKYAANLQKRESMDQRLPLDLWEIGYDMPGAGRVLFTIAEVDECVRSDPQINFTGWLSLTILEVNLVLHYQRNMLMCTQCCGFHVYASTTMSKCKSCDKEVELQLNPKIIGTLIDETGSISTGKAVWSEQAWEQLFGRRVEELVAENIPVMRLMEQRMLFLRVHMMFGWAEEVGKLAILAVAM